MLTVTVMALAAEAVLRYHERHRPTVPGLMPLIFYQHRRLRHALVRESDYFGWVHVGRQGFRGADVAVDKAPGVVRIMVVGSSTTFDGNVRGGDQATWPARLQFWLNESQLGRRVEVINAGVPGYRVLEDLIRLQTELCRFRPDIVILYDGHNDLFAALGSWREGWQPDPYTPDESPVVTPWGRWLSRHSLLYGKVLGKLGVIRFAASGRGRTHAPPPEKLVKAGAQEFERDVRSFLLVARGMGIRVVVPELVQVSGATRLTEPDSMIRAMWWRAMPFAPPEAVLQGYRQYNSVLREAALQTAAFFVPTHDFDLTGTEWYAEGDPIHFNDRGADRMGQRMANALRGVGVFPR
jgi:lysophospholipase L1-like esterase